MKGTHIIRFPVRGDQEEGHLHILESNGIPFDIKRVFYTADTPEGVIRGRHAHFETEMVLIALQGEIEVKTICHNGKEETFTLHSPGEGLYIPRLCWHQMNYSKDAIQLVVCSTDYQEADYIRDWQQFRSLMETHGHE
jgi:dTDP-4-dehydrorhamnose 3,5-epimerase-like enzyme